MLHRSSWQEVVRAKGFPQLSKVREMARHRGLLEQFSSQFEEICSELFLPCHQAWLIWEKCPNGYRKSVQWPNGRHFPHGTDSLATVLGRRVCQEGVC